MNASEIKAPDAAYHWLEALRQRCQTEAPEARPTAEELCQVFMAKEEEGYCQ